MESENKDAPEYVYNSINKINVSGAIFRTDVGVANKVYMYVSKTWELQVLLVPEKLNSLLRT